jgi:hypothetical protein
MIKQFFFLSISVPTFLSRPLSLVIFCFFKLRALTRDFFWLILNLLSPYAVTRLFTSEVFLLLTHCLHRSGSYITFPVPDKLPDFCGGCPDLLTVGPIEFSKKAIGRLLACLDVSYTIFLMQHWLKLWEMLLYRFKPFLLNFRIHLTPKICLKLGYE